MIAGKITHFRLIIVILLGYAVASLPATAEQTSEYQLKAAYLLNLAKFVQWPDAALQSPELPFSFCLIGLGQYAHVIDGELTGKTVHGRSTRSQHLSFSDSLIDCHVLFVSDIGDTRLSYVIKETGAQYLLVIGEQTDFILRGGDINFFAEPKRLRFEINPVSIKHKGLDVSSKLLNLARVIEVPVKAGEQGK